jgi:predicted PurR-regulated permease PerM
MMIVEQVPQYEDRIKALYDWVADLFDLPNDQALTIWQNLWDQTAIRAFVRDFTFYVSNASFRFVSSAVLVVIFLVFMLLEASYFKLKLIAAFENRFARLSNIGNEIINQVTRYLGAKFLFSLANGIIYSIGFTLIGLEFAIVWGVIQFFMNFIPTLGSIATGVAISLFALIQFWPDPAPVIAVVAIILGVNMVLSNFLDPKLVGEHVGISPLVVLVSLSIWGYIWGFIGMILAVPLTVIIKIVCENIPIMEPVSILLGSKKSVLAKKAEYEKDEEQNELPANPHE